MYKMFETPVLEFESFRLVPFDEIHLNARTLSWLKSPEVVKYSENRHRSHDLETCRSYWQGMVAGGHHYWAIELCGDEIQHVGNLTAYCDRFNAISELAIMLGESQVRGKGVGKAVWQGAMDWLLSDGGMRKVHAGTMAVNQPMRRIFQATGMTVEAVRPRHFLWNGQEVDMICVGKFSSHWQGEDA